MPLAYGLIEPLDLSLPALPAVLQGLRLAHLSDLHVRRRRRRYRHVARQLSALRLDLLVLSGDYMTRGGPETPCLEVLREILSAVHVAHGVYGVLGNHDSDQLAEQLRQLPVTWLDNQAVRHPKLPLEIVGVGREVDGVTLARAVAALGTEYHADPLASASDRPLRLGISHAPDLIGTLADLGVDLMLAGHTHGGQMRLPGKRVLVNSSDLPLHLSTGLLRHRSTLGVVSRGLGEVKLPLRLLCPPHVPLYTLRPGPMPGQVTPHIACIQRW